MSFLNSQERAKAVGIKVNSNPFEQSYQTLLEPQVSSLLNSEQVRLILDRCQKDNELYPVGLQGLSDVSDEEAIGSHRQTLHDIGLAQYLTQKIWTNPDLFITPVVLDEYSPVDWQSKNPDKLNYWTPLHVSPVFRYMEYSEGGEHYTHYDAPYIDKTNPLIRTLQSGVLYLTTNDVCTRFIDEIQSSLPFVDRNLSDWTEPTDPSLILNAVSSTEGFVLLFPHQLPHDVSKHPGKDKRIIIRFDIFYQAVGKV